MVTLTRNLGGLLISGVSFYLYEEGCWGGKCRLKINGTEVRNWNPRSNSCPPQPGWVQCGWTEVVECRTIEIQAWDLTSSNRLFVDDIRVFPVVPPEPRFRRGDTNSDGDFDITDVQVLLGALFKSEPRELSCEKTADLDDNGVLEITDAVYLLRFLFLEAPRPPAPHLECGEDDSEDAITCEEFERCGQ